MAFLPGRKLIWNRSLQTEVRTKVCAARTCDNDSAVRSDVLLRRNERVCAGCDDCSRSEGIADNVEAAHAAVDVIDGIDDHRPDSTW